jgi:hypothetical protein
LLQKSFWGDERNFLGPLMRFVCGDVRDLIVVVAIRVEDVAAGGYTADRATVRQKKTGRPVRFELSEQARQPSMII